jgi:hypothetical protein
MKKSVLTGETLVHESSHSRRILSSDTAALWLLGLAFTGLHLVVGARYGFHRDELLTYSNAVDLEGGYVLYPPRRTTRGVRLRDKLSRNRSQ